MADLRRKRVRCLANIGSTFSGVGASGKPGGVQTDSEWKTNSGARKLIALPYLLGSNLGIQRTEKC